MRLDMIGIIVTDMKKSLEFYESFGLVLKEKYSDDYIELESESIRISLNTREMIEGVYGFKPTISGERLELAFMFDSKDELDDRVTLLKKINTKILREPWETVWGQYYAVVEDPDGNILSLFTDLKD